MDPMNKKLKEVDRQQFLDNLFYLIGMNGMTYSEVESAVGVYNGYISRMKSDPQKLPALDIAWKMAQLLDVNLEWLMEGSCDDLDENVQYVGGFLRKLFDLTRSKRMLWECWPVSKIENACKGQKMPDNFPCLGWGPDGHIRPDSLAFPGWNNSITNTAFVSDLDDNRVICVVPMQYNEELKDGETFSNRWIEVQLMDKKTKHRSLITCTSYGADDMLWDDIEKLYQELSRQETDLRLDPFVRNAIDGFMEKWKNGDDIQ